MGIPQKKMVLPAAGKGIPNNPSDLSKADEFGIGLIGSLLPVYNLGLIPMQASCTMALKHICSVNDLSNQWDREGPWGPGGKFYDPSDQKHHVCDVNELSPYIIAIFKTQPAPI